MKKNKIFKGLAAMALLTAVMLMSSCAATDNAAILSDVPTIHGDGVANHAATIEIGQNLQLTPGTDYPVVWKSSDEAVATVTQAGLVTGVALGVTNVTVYKKDFDDMTNGNYVLVTVVDKSVGVADDAIDQSEAE